MPNLSGRSIIESIAIDAQPHDHDPIGLDSENLERENPFGFRVAVIRVSAADVKSRMDGLKLPSTHSTKLAVSTSANEERATSNHSSANKTSEPATVKKTSIQLPDDSQEVGGAGTAIIRISEEGNDEGGSGSKSSNPEGPDSESSVNRKPPLRPTSSKKSALDIYSNHDIDGLTVYQRMRSRDLLTSSASLYPGVNTNTTAKIDRTHSLSRGEKPLKSVLVKKREAEAAAVPKTKNNVRSTRAKSIKFAVDRNGLDIASIRFISNQDDPPEIPLYATAYLNLDPVVDEQPSDTRSINGEERLFKVAFMLPSMMAGFEERVIREKVVLESCVITDNVETMTGTVRVANISYQKAVSIRYTTDQWKSFNDVSCSFIYYTPNSTTDRFAFNLTMPASLTVGGQLEFCVDYRAGTDHFWDNNRQNNYVITCHSPQTLPDQADTTYFKSNSAIADYSRSPGSWLHYL